LSGCRRQALKTARRIAQAVFSVTVVVGILWGVLPRMASFGRVWTIVGSFRASEQAILVAAAVWNLVTYWAVVMAGLPGLTLAQAAVANQTATTVAMTVPGGGAIAVGVSYSMFSSWGFRRGAIALSAVITGIWNIALKLALPALALALVAIRGEGRHDLVPAALIGVGLLVAAAGGIGLMAWKEEYARRIGAGLGSAVSSIARVLGRRPVTSWGRTAVQFRARAASLVRRRWALLTTATVVSQLSVYVVMLLSVRAAGISAPQVGWAEVLVVFAFVRLASVAPIVPGNAGLAELGYVAGLILWGAPRAPAVAAVLVFRVLTYYAQIPLGGITYLAWLRTKGWRRPAPARAAVGSGAAMRPA
jgi:putative heme transporter